MRQWLNVSILVLFGLASWQIFVGSWIGIKAALAQQLIAAAWVESANSVTPAKPWPWADTWPVAKLEFKQHSYYVLAGATGNALAFGPGYLIGTAKPNGQGTTIIAGHRDTHFRFLKDLVPGDSLSLSSYQNHKTITRQYRIETAHISDSRTEKLTISDNENRLLLVTCFPFEQLSAGGPLRYVVSATRI